MTSFHKSHSTFFVVILLYCLFSGLIGSIFAFIFSRLSVGLFLSSFLHWRAVSVLLLCSSKQLLKGLCWCLNAELGFSCFGQTGVLQTRFSCGCRTSRPQACLERLGWIFQLILDFENVSAFHARASFLAIFQPSFVLFCSQIRRCCRATVWLGHRTYKRCPLAGRPLPGQFCSWWDENCELRHMVLIVYNESVISIWLWLHINQVYLAPRIHVMWKYWTYD